MVSPYETDPLLKRGAMKHTLALHRSSWTRELDRLRTRLPEAAVPLAREIAVTADIADREPIPDQTSPAWIRLRALVEAIRLVAPLLPDEPTPGHWPKPEYVQGMPHEVYRVRMTIAVVREELEAVQRREEAAASLGLRKYALLSLIREERRDGPTATDLNKAVAYEYAYGKNTQGEPWSMADLAGHLGVSKATVQERIEAGRAAWAKAGSPLPR